MRADLQPRDYPGRRAHSAQRVDFPDRRTYLCPRVDAGDPFAGEGARRAWRDPLAIDPSRVARPRRALDDEDRSGVATCATVTHMS